MGSRTLLSQVVPATPQKFTTRNIGDSVTGASVGFTPAKPKVTVRTVTVTVLSPMRQWITVDGKSFLGKLIAFEDPVVEKKQDAAEKPVSQATPAVPKQPTVIRDGKARFLVDSKRIEVPMKRLGGAECLFIEKIRDDIAAQE